MKCLKRVFHNISASSWSQISGVKEGILLTYKMDVAEVNEVNNEQPRGGTAG